MFPKCFPFHRHGGMLALLLGLLGAGVASPLQAATSQKSAKKNAPPSSVRFIDAPSAESPAARKQRLKRECKGRPNAGACLGMTGRD